MLTEASTLEGIESDLQNAEEELRKAQNDLIAELEAGVKLEQLKPKEQLVELLTARRDEFLGTKEFVIDRARQVAIRDGKRHSTALYLSKWTDAFSAAEVGSIIIRANAKNEAVGITGVLFLFPGWFSSFLEGEELALTQLLKRIARDHRHTQFSIIHREVNLPPGTPRRFPKSGLTLRRMDETVVDHRTTFECCAIQHLSQQMALSSYVPRPVIGDSMIRRAVGNNVLVDDVKKSITQAVIPEPLAQFVLCVSPQESFWVALASATHPAEAAALRGMIQEVFDVVKSVVELPHEESRFVSAGGTAPSTNPDHFQGTVVAPHSSDLGIVATIGNVVRVAIERVLGIWSKLKALGVVQNEEANKKSPQKKEPPCGELFLKYRPTIVLHYGKIEPAMDGACTIVGPPIRILRLLTNVAKQEGFPIVFSWAIAEEAREVEMCSLGEFELDQEKLRLWGPTMTSDLRWNEINAAEMRRRTEVELSDSAQQGGVPQVIATVHHNRQHRVELDAALDVSPPKQLESEDELRNIFDSLNPDPKNGTVALADFSALFLSADACGVIEDPREVESFITERFAVNADEPDRLNFEQFCLMWYRRLRM